MGYCYFNCKWITSATALLMNCKWFASMPTVPATTADGFKYELQLLVHAAQGLLYLYFILVGLFVHSFVSCDLGAHGFDFASGDMVVL